MIRCKNCKKEITNKQYGWVHKETEDFLCFENKEYVATPLKFCISCNEPQSNSETCGCGYGYIIKE